MFAVESGKLVEKLYLADLTAEIQATRNRLLLKQRNELLLLAIVGKASEKYVERHFLSCATLIQLPFSRSQQSA